MMEGARRLTEDSDTSPRYLPSQFLQQVDPLAHLTASCESKVVPCETPPAGEAHCWGSGSVDVAPGRCAVRRSARYGRYLVTSQDVSEGEVLFQEFPMLVVPKAGCEPSCLACMRPLRAGWAGCRRCGGPLCRADCRGGRHTERECCLLQRMGLKHAPHIDALIKELNLIIGPLRFLLLVQESPAARDVFLYLESHAEKRRKLPIGKLVEEYVVGGLRQRLGLELSSEVVHQACGVLDTNSFELTLDNGGRGRAVFATAAMMNHSCLPNAHWWFWRGRLLVRAAQDIPKGRPVLINYTQTLWGTGARAAQLTACKMFTCTCRRCLDPTELDTHLSSVRCRACGGVMPPPGHRLAPWQCRGCGNATDATTVEAMVRAAATTLARLKEESPADVAAAAEHLSRVLGPRHYLVLQARQCFLEAIFAAPLEEASAEQLEETVVAAQQLAAVLQVLEPGESRLKGLLLYYETAAAAAAAARRGGGSDKEVTQVLLKQAGEAERVLQHDRMSPAAAALAASLLTACDLLGRKT